MKSAYNKAKLSRSENDIQGYKQLQKESQYECRKAYNGYVNCHRVQKNPNCPMWESNLGRRI